MRRALRQFVIFGLVGVVVTASGVAQQTMPSGIKPTAATIPARADVTLGQSAVPLHGPWRFRVGDSPVNPATGGLVWAQPGFDDSKWETVDLTAPESSVEATTGMSGYVPGWTTQGHPGYAGYAWYRIRVRVSGLPGAKLALAGPSNVDDAYQLFANGGLVGSFGDFSRATPVEYNTQPMLFRLPEGHGEDELVLAFRVWMSSQSLEDADDAGGLHNAPVLGEDEVVTNGYRLRWLDMMQSLTTTAAVAVVSLLLSIVAFSLILFDRSDRVYLWIGMLYLVLAVFNGLTVFDLATTLVPEKVDYFVEDCLLSGVISALWVIVWWIWFGRRPAWTPWAAGGLAVVFIASRAVGRELIPGLIAHGSAPIFELVSLAVRLLWMGLMLTIVIQGIRRQGIEGWLVLPAVVLRGITAFAPELIRFHVVYPRLMLFGVAFSLGQIGYLLLALALTLLLLRRLLNSVKAQRQMALDVKQAQEVQQMILPEERVAYPGLVVETVFRPAREVGGDFFQMIPNEADGSLLIVAGDVAGKGLQAGMLVALLVGSIRTAVEMSYDPAFVLGVLNRRLVGRGEAAATCLAMRIAEDGRVTLANAGHMPPYLNGQPVAMDGALPLGMFAGAECSVMRFQLAEGDCLMLMSDGILEAMDGNGQLFGFERIAALLGSPVSAAQVADAAQAFGQEDDISVISVVRKQAFETAPQPALMG